MPLNRAFRGSYNDIPLDGSGGNIQNGILLSITRLEENGEIKTGEENNNDGKEKMHFSAGTIEICSVIAFGQTQDIFRHNINQHRQNKN